MNTKNQCSIIKINMFILAASRMLRQCHDYMELVIRGWNYII